MSSNHTQNVPSPSPSTLFLPLGRRSRRGSLSSLSSQVDKEQLSLALDQIHNSASQSETLTTFNDFASPPSASAGADGKRLAGDLVQSGLSGLYNRFRDAVDGVKDKVGGVVAVNDQRGYDDPAKSPSSLLSHTKSISRGSIDSLTVVSPSGAASTPLSRLPSPLTTNFGPEISGVDARLKNALRPNSTVASSQASITSAGGSGLKSPLPPLTKPLSTIDPTVAPVNVSAFQDTDNRNTYAWEEPERGLPSDTSTRSLSLSETKSKTGRADSDRRNQRTISGGRLVPDQVDGPANRVSSSKDWNILSPAEIRQSDDPLEDGLDIESIPSDDQVSNVLQNPQTTSIQHTIGLHEKSVSSADIRASRHTANGSTHSIKSFDGSATFEHRRSLSKSDGSQQVRNTSAKLDIVRPERHFRDSDTILTESSKGRSRESSITLDGVKDINIATDNSRTSKNAQVNSGSASHPKNFSSEVKNKVLSREFWMRDENAKDCFYCGDTFSTWRRKHHCRTCGQIFDSKCTSLISGKRFGQSGNIRVCKPCEAIIQADEDDSSEFSDDEVVLPPSFFTKGQGDVDSERADQNIVHDSGECSKGAKGEDIGSRGLNTPMMAIPATRRPGDPSSRRSAILEFTGDQPNLRPSSSRSIMPPATARPHSHRAYHPRHQLSRSVRSFHEDRAPFHRSSKEDLGRFSRLPAFHNDSIIDPELAPFMSDEGSSEDEQMSIFTTMAGDNQGRDADSERDYSSGQPPSSRKSRSRTLEKIAGFGHREGDEANIVSFRNLPRTSRNRTHSAASTTHQRPSPRTYKSTAFSRGHAATFAETGGRPPSVHGLAGIALGGTRLMRSASMRGDTAPPVELNDASLEHVRKLLRQLLQDFEVPSSKSWENALVPMLLRCSDDVNPDVRSGDDIDIRHYVKLKKIPGGRPCDTSYVSGIVFSKNLALKSMPRNIPHPGILLVTFPVEYHRHQQHFMSLEPIIAQEREFVRKMVNRIVALNPQLLLAQKNVSGLALQYLDEANIATAYNVKPSVIAAVSRFCETDIVSSIDRLATSPRIGESDAFEVRTFKHEEIPGRRKSYFYISGCPRELGCTIVLRGADLQTLSKVKRITEFLVYVVYNLKLETALMRDESVFVPSTETPMPPPGPKSVSEVSPAISAGESVASDQNGGDSEERAEATAQSPGLTYSDTQSPGSDNKSANKDFEIDNHDDLPLPANIPMPTFYEDMVHKYETKVLSASPLVRFPQPYLLMRAREQERRLAYLRLLRDQDDSEDQSADDSSRQEEFHLIQPEMIHEKVEGAPKKVREVLRAVHDAEYDRALHNYETQKRQWEAFISANDDLFDPLVHQNIVVLFSVVCTITTVPCSGPDMLALSFYNEHETEPSFEADCTLGQYVEELCLSANSVCTANGCERRMIDHHRQYVHGEACLSIFVEKHKPKLRDMPDVIAMWSYCKICKQETAAKPMSEDTWKYSFAKYLEMSFWNAELHKKGGLCPHDATRDHLRYFSFKDVAVRIHYDRIHLLEIIVPRSRITWKVDRDLRLKNEEYVRIEERLNRFMTSVKGRIKGMNTESVVPEKAEACKEEIEKLIQRSNDEHDFLLKKLQEKYMNSKYFEIIPLNRAVRALQEKVAEWDSAFADFDEKFFPSEKDIRRLTALQLKKIFLDREDSVSSITDEGTESPSVISENDITGGDSEKPALSFSPRPTNLSPEKAHDMLASVVDEHSQSSDQSAKEQLIGPGDVDPSTSETLPMQRQARNVSHEDVQHLDLAMPSRFPENNVDEQNMPSPGSASVSPKTTKSGLSPEEPTVSSSDEPDNSKIESGGPPRKSVSSTINTEDTAKASGIPRLQDGRFRRMGSSSSPPLQRAHSQPAHAQRVASDQRNTGDVSMEAENPKIARVESSKPPELRLSERLGLSGTKSGKKNLTPSLIPRSVPGNRIGSKVSTLAKHFEELSREFELERLRERRRHAARMKQARAYPMVSSKPIVEVYRDVDAAVEEKEPSDEEARPIATATPMADTTDTTDSATLDKLTAEAQGSHIDRSQEESKAISDEATVTGGEAQTSDIDEGTDAEESLLDDLQGSTDNSQILSPAEGQMEMKLDLPKHEKSSLMKKLTNFWAERSASGWTSLDYPLNATDHVFIDSDVVVREDEPSSLIAFALSSQDYLGKLNSIRKQGQMQSQDNVESGNGISNEADLERSLLRATGTHLKYQFQEGSAKMLCKIFYAEQFDAMRRKCGIADRFVETLSRCLKWDSKGGKTRSVFLKTLDDRFVLKSLSTIETQAFLRFAPAYFQIMSQALFHELPSVIAKMVGFYQIIIRNPATGTDMKWDVVVMENLFYDRNPTRIFDLKGSMRNRKIQSTGEQNEVLLDENMVDFIYESPLFAREHSKKLLRASVWNDTLFLARQNVMDYSLMIAIDENRKELVVGIIDCIRTYTWDKKLESWIKDRGFAGGGRNRPTVTSPKEYKNRFREAMARYVLEAPSCWHQFEPQQMEKRPLRIDERAENREGDRTETEVEVPAHISSDPSENPEPLKRGSENI